MVPEKSAAPAKKKGKAKVDKEKFPKTRKEAGEEAGELKAASSPVMPQVREEKSAAEPSAAKPLATFKEGDDYTVLVRFDKAQKCFLGEVVELPSCKVKGASRDEVLKELKIQVEDFIEDHRHQGGIPEALFSKTYPETLTLTLSQSVFRKLDMLSRMEKMELEKVAAELLAVAAERRFDSGKGNAKHNQPHSNASHGRHSHHGGGHRHGGGHGNRNRHSQGNLDSRENFMEYVRNLEKGGGNRWKK